VPATGHAPPSSRPDRASKHANTTSRLSAAGWQWQAVCRSNARDGASSTALIVNRAGLRWSRSRTRASGRQAQTFALAQQAVPTFLAARQRHPPHRSRDMATPMAAYPTFRPTAQRQNREPNDISQFRSRAGISCAKSMPCLASLLASARREPRLLSRLLPGAACWTRCHPAPGCSPGHPRHLRARIPLRRGHPTGSGGKLAATCFI
jgi:hypothetical protein